MSEELKDDLRELMKKYGPEKVDSITDKDSAIKHFRTSSEVYKKLGEGYKRERDEIKRERNILKEENEILREMVDALEARKKGSKHEVVYLFILLGVSIVINFMMNIFVF